mgnify:CR=1 FL=1|jgi:two-component system OmpR family sensor kinase
MKFSIRNRLTWALLLAIVMLSTGASIATYLQARSDINALFDYEMQQMSWTLSMHISAHPNLSEEPLLRVEHDFVTQVWSKSNQLLMSSRPGNGPDRILPAGFSDFGKKNDGWRTYTSLAGEFVLQVAQPQSLRHRMATDIAVKAMAPILAIIPIGGVIIWLLIGYGLSPLRTVTREVESRDPASLRLIEATKLPTEVAPLVISLNALLGRLERALKSEREFIAEASHELRTPVTALRLQLELLETASTADEREESIQDLKQGVERISRLIEQILTLARLDPENIGKPSNIDLTALVHEISQNLAHIVASKSIEFKISTEDRIVASCDLASATALIRNILDNALRYTPENGTVSLLLSMKNSMPQIQITDNGPGIPLEIREKVFSRFFRANHETDTTGTGLGLAIARRAAERLGATLELQDGPSGKGLIVLITFSSTENHLHSTS